MSLGERLRRLREDRGWTQTEVADRLNVSSVTVNRYESGERNPGSDMLIALADLFRVSIDYLLGRSDVPTVLPDATQTPHLPEPDQHKVHFYVQPRDSVLGQLTAHEQETYLEMCKLPQSPFGGTQNAGTDGMTDDVIVALVRVLEIVKDNDDRLGRVPRKRKPREDGER